MSDLWAHSAYRTNHVAHSLHNVHLLHCIQAAECKLWYYNSSQDSSVQGFKGSNLETHEDEVLLLCLACALIYTSSSAEMK